MFHKKNLSAIFTAVIFFSITCNQVWSASRNITSLKLDFLRTEEVIKDNQTTSMSGTIIYNKNPFVFIFILKTPAEQTLYVNEENAFLIDGGLDSKKGITGTVYDVAQNKEFLMQTCEDFLNWFKPDYGLADSNFKTAVRWTDENMVVTQWDSYNFEDQPLDKVLVWSDSQGCFKKLTMYSSGNTLVTETNLLAFANSNGDAYPTIIESTSFEEDSPFIKMELKLSKVSFVLSQEDNLIIETLASEASKNCVEFPSFDNTKELAVATPVIPQQASYKVSIPTVIAGASFSFYKKFITSQDMSNCPFYPSCSQFMLEAISTNGLFGFIQGLERLKRCTSTEHKRGLYPTLNNGKHYDPVPPLKKK